MPNPSNIIPVNDLPIVSPSGFDWLVAADSSLGTAVRIPLPQVTTASALISEAISSITQSAMEEASAVLNGIGYLPPVNYASGLNVSSTRYTVSYDGNVYAPVSEQVPFVTGATFDPSKWRVIQGITLDFIETYQGSASVGYRQNGDDAIVRSVSDKLSDVVSVKDFGAVGDDITDNRASFQKALDATPNYGSLFIPAGKYAFSGPVNISNKCITIYGAGFLSTFLRFVNGTNGIQIFNTGAPPLDESYTVTIRDCWFYTNNQSDLATNKAIYYRQPAPGVDGGQAQQSLLVQNCFFSGIFKFDQWWPFAVYAENAPNILIDKCFYQGQANLCKGDAFYAAGKSDVLKVTNSQAIFCNSGVTQESSNMDDFGSEGLIVIGTGIDDCNFGVRKLHQNASGIGEPLLEVIGCQISARGIAIYGVNAYDISIHDCLIYLQGTALQPIQANPTGIRLDRTSNANSIKNFTISQCGVALLDNPSGTGTGIYTAASDGAISLNRLSGFDGPAIHVDAMNVYVSRSNIFSNCVVEVLNQSGGAVTDRPLIPMPTTGFPNDPSYGRELLSNPYFDGSTGWTLGSGWTVTGGKAVHSGSSAGGIASSLNLAEGSRYRVEISVSAYASGTGLVGFLGGVSNTTVIPSGVGTFVVYLLANAGNNQLYFEAEANQSISIDSISVRQV